MNMAHTTEYVKKPCLLSEKSL